MFLTPSVIYPLSEVAEEYRFLAGLNPLTAVIETFKFGFLGEATFSWLYFGSSITITILLFLTGVLVFNKTEKNFMDVI
jgi:lipopolysaccharide transport system permease protein